MLHSRFSKGPNGNIASIREWGTLNSVRTKDFLAPLSPLGHFLSVWDRVASPEEYNIS